MALKKSSLLLATTKIYSLFNRKSTQNEEYTKIPNVFDNKFCVYENVFLSAHLWFSTHKIQI